MPMTPLIVSFFTPSYRRYVETLRMSCKHFGYSYLIEEKPCVGTWEDNRSLKAGFVRACWKKHRQLIWIDADAEILRPLDHFSAPIDFDFAVFRRPHKRMPFRGGTLYFGDSEAAGLLLEDWEAGCTQTPAESDQVHIYTAWNERKAGLNTSFLPVSYCQKYNEIPTRD